LRGDTKPGEDIGLETHLDNDQFFRFEKGTDKCLIDDSEYPLQNGAAIVVPAGAQHNIINTSQTENLLFYTVYSPAHHQDGIIRASKEEAVASAPEFEGKTTE
jgi:mannose-6-phosphate isomerase-like protein (cupin superfamily)